MRFILILFALVIISCDANQTTHSQDYDAYLSVSGEEAYENKKTILNFWNDRIEKDSLQLIAMAKSADANTALFHHTADIAYLKNAETLLQKSIDVAAIDKHAYMQSLAHNYISQHRFKEAQAILEDAQKVVGETDNLNFMLFDVHLELGNYNQAENHLAKTENLSDFNYLTRMAKWQDYKGNLSATIHNMEKALIIAERSNKDALKIWTYTNLADYYGHDGRIKDSYNFYLKALEIEPANTYAKKGIAWITYSHEKNSAEAIRIINAINKEYQSPDYHLLRAEIAEYEGDWNRKTKEINSYFKAVSNKDYGVMYDYHTASILAEEDRDIPQALKLAQKEVQQRPTPQSYDLLAQALLANGDYKKALETAQQFVENKTYEPTALLHTAQIYKANGLNEKVNEIKKELLEAGYELGPLKMVEIRNL